jgi:probable DNA metabolism protein
MENSLTSINREILICQPNLTGFLSAIYDKYYSFKSADFIQSSNAPINLLDNYTQINETPEKAEKVKSGIIKKGGKNFFKEICYAYLSGNTEKEQIIFEYLQLFFKRGRQVLNMFDNIYVIKFNDLKQKVLCESHRLKAFIRLQQTVQGIYYGFFSSDNDILELIAPDYVQRFNTQEFILHDYKRQKICYYNGKKLHYAIVPDGLEIELSNTEKMFQSLWKQYFKNVNIKERKNPRLQRQFLPKKYRHFMHEFETDDNK